MKCLLTSIALSVIILSPSANASDLHHIVSNTAHRHGVSPRIAWAVMKVESGGNCNAVSSAGALGAMQVKPATARGVGVRGNLRNCQTGIEAGMRYLRQAMNKYGSLCAALSAYNRGLYARPTCSAYGRKVLRVASM
jgi:soluble lytic murein transglycosylase-like protein